MAGGAEERRLTSHLQVRAARAMFATVALRIVSISFTDDEYMSARNTPSMLGFVARAPVKTVRITPQDIGVARIGHFGFFRPSFESSLWASTWLPELGAAG
jgi:predicted alpha/beta hydrolase